MKHRSISKVRSTKLAKKTRFVAIQLSNANKQRGGGFRQVWVSNVFMASHTDPQTNVIIPAMIMKGNGTYSRAKHDIPMKGLDGYTTVRRYVAS